MGERSTPLSRYTGPRMAGDSKGPMKLHARKPTNRWIVVIFLVGMGAVVFLETHPTLLSDLVESNPPLQDRRAAEAGSPGEPQGESVGISSISPTATRVQYSSLKPVLSAIQPLRHHRNCDSAPRIKSTAYRAVLKDGIQSGIQTEKGQGVAKAWGLALIRLPVEQMWMAVNDEESYPGTLPVTVSEVFQGEPYKDGRLVFQKMTLPGPFKDRWWIIKKRAGERLYTATDGRVWEACAQNATDPSLLVGSPLKKHLEGAQPVNWTYASWTLIALSEEITLVEYFTWTDPGGSLPAGPASRFASSAVKRTMAKIEQLARQYKPEDMLHFTRPDGTPLAKPVDVDGLAEPPDADEASDPAAP